MFTQTQRPIQKKYVDAVQGLDSDQDPIQSRVNRVMIDNLIYRERKHPPVGNKNAATVSVSYSLGGRVYRKNFNAVSDGPVNDGINHAEQIAWGMAQTWYKSFSNKYEKPNIIHIDIASDRPPCVQKGNRNPCGPFFSEGGTATKDPLPFQPGRDLIGYSDGNEGVLLKDISQAWKLYNAKQTGTSYNPSSSLLTSSFDPSAASTSGSRTSELSSGFSSSSPPAPATSSFAPPPTNAWTKGPPKLQTQQPGPSLSSNSGGDASFDLLTGSSTSSQPGKLNFGVIEDLKKLQQTGPDQDQSTHFLTKQFDNYIFFRAKDRKTAEAIVAQLKEKKFSGSVQEVGGDSDGKVEIKVQPENEQDRGIVEEVRGRFGLD